MKNILKIIAFFTFVSLFAGCSNLANSDDSNDGKNGLYEPEDSSKGALEIRLGSSGERYVLAYDFNLSNFSTWTCTFKDENDDDAESFSVSTSDSSGTASLKYNDKILTAGNIPAGTYTVTITGSYTPDSDDETSTYAISGSKSGVEIAQGETASADIFVGMTKTEKGSLSLTLTDEKQLLSNIYQDLIISLKNLNGETDYSYSAADKTTFNFSKDDSGSSYSLASLSDNNLESGWYLLSVYCNNYKIILSDSIIEIADGIKTTTTITLSAAGTKTYYATNNDASGNGLSALSRINLSDLLENLAAELPDECEIIIYVNGTPEIDLDKFASLKSKIAETGKSFTIYNSNESTETEAITLISSDTGDPYTTTTNIAGALTLTAGAETTLAADKITVEENAAFTITLKNGAAMNVTTPEITGMLGICAVKSDGQEVNFSAYTSNPFLTTTSSISNKIMLYDADGNAASFNANETSSGQTSYTYTAQPSETSNL